MVIQKRASVINGKSLYGKRWKLLGIKEESFVQTPATGLIMGCLLVVNYRTNE